MIASTNSCRSTSMARQPRPKRPPPAVPRGGRTKARETARRRAPPGGGGNAGAAPPTRRLARGWTEAAALPGTRGHAITTMPVEMGQARPYDDQLSDDGLLLYRYRGTDPNHRDNAGLR